MQSFLLILCESWSVCSHSSHHWTHTQGEIRWSPTYTCILTPLIRASFTISDLYSIHTIVSIIPQKYICLSRFLSHTICMNSILFHTAFWMIQTSCPPHTLWLKDYLHWHSPVCTHTPHIPPETIRLAQQTRSLHAVSWVVCWFPLEEFHDSGLFYFVTPSSTIVIYPIFVIDRIFIVFSSFTVRCRLPHLLFSKRTGTAEETCTTHFSVHLCFSFMSLKIWPWEPITERLWSDAGPFVEYVMKAQTFHMQIDQKKKEDMVGLCPNFRRVLQRKAEHLWQC